MDTSLVQNLKSNRKKKGMKTPGLSRRSDGGMKGKDNFLSVCHSSHGITTHSALCPNQHINST